MSQRSLGLLLVGAGFLAGAFLSVREIESVPWIPWGGAALVMLVGLLLVRSAPKRIADEHEHRASAATLRRSLERLRAELAALLAAREETDVYAVRHAIDERLLPDLDAFVSVRETMIPRFGVQAYADVMSAFATGERLLNRAWSASADGYIDEVWASVESAAQQMDEAYALLERAEGGATARAASEREVQGIA